MSPLTRWGLARVEEAKVGLDLFGGLITRWGLPFALLALLGTCLLGAGGGWMLGRWLAGGG